MNKDISEINKQIIGKWKVIEPKDINFTFHFDDKKVLVYDNNHYYDYNIIIDGNRSFINLHKMGGYEILKLNDKELIFKTLPLENKGAITFNTIKLLNEL